MTHARLEYDMTGEGARSRAASTSGFKYIIQLQAFLLHLYEPCGVPPFNTWGYILVYTGLFKRQQTHLQTFNMFRHIQPGGQWL